MRVLAIVLLASTMITTAGASAPAGQSAGSGVPVVSDLGTAASVAEARGVALLIEFAASDCGYCKLLEREHLRPMIKGGQYKDKVLIRKVLIDQGEWITDFQGRDIPASKLSFRYDVMATPTVVLVNGQGQELAEPLVGFQADAFYGSFLDAAIERSLERLREGQALSQAAR